MRETERERVSERESERERERILERVGRKLKWGRGNRNKKKKTWSCEETENSESICWKMLSPQKCQTAGKKTIGETQMKQDIPCWRNQ